MLAASVLLLVLVVLVAVSLLDVAALHAAAAAAAAELAALPVSFHLCVPMPKKYWLANNFQHYSAAPPVFSTLLVEMFSCCQLYDLAYSWTPWGNSFDNNRG